MKQSTGGRMAAAFSGMLAALLPWGCGYVGDPLPPALNIAMPVSDLRAVEYGSNLVVNFTIPPLTTEGAVLKRIGTVELRIGPGVEPWNLDRWAEQAAVFPIEPQSTGPVEHAVPASDFVGKDVVVAVRIINRKGRASGWSNLASLTVRPPLAPPSDLKAEAVADGVKLTWSGAAPEYRIFRATGSAEPAQIGASDKPEYVDSTAAYGVQYRYLLQAVHDKTESVISQPVAITPEDRFAPPAPADLIASPGAGSIELVWQRSTTSDFKNYRVYRALGDGPWQLIGEPPAPSFSDRQVESGKTYRYAVTAVDLKGNESEKSAPAQVAAP